MLPRFLVLACVAALSGCATTSEVGPPPPWQVDPAPPPQTQLSQRDECAAGCQAKYDRCTDDSAKERSEPHTNCFEDLRDCQQRCDAAASADPATRIGEDVGVTNGATIVIGNGDISGSIPTVSKGR